MRIELTAQEAEMLLALLDAAVRERHHQVHHSDSRDYRKRLERDLELIESVRAKLAGVSKAA
jgi:hypothetical protein